jgi:hypothetical protein
MREAVAQDEAATNISIALPSQRDVIKTAGDDRHPER